MGRPVWQKQRSTTFFFFEAHEFKDLLHKLKDPLFCGGGGGQRPTRLETTFGVVTHKLGRPTFGSRPANLEDQLLGRHPQTWETQHCCRQAFFAVTPLATQTHFWVFHTTHRLRTPPPCPHLKASSSLLSLSSSFEQHVRLGFPAAVRVCVCVFVPHFLRLRSPLKLATGCVNKSFAAA